VQVSYVCEQQLDFLVTCYILHFVTEYTDNAAANSVNNR